MCGGEETVSIGAAAASSAWCKATSSRTECSGYETMHGRVSLRAVGMKLIKKLSRNLIIFHSFCGSEKRLTTTKILYFQF